MNSPYGGTLVNRYIAPESQRDLSGLPRVVMSDTGISDLYNIAEGVFSPLTGFMAEKQFRDVVGTSTFIGLPWTIPIILDIDKQAAHRAGEAGAAALTDENGRILGRMKVEDVYFHDKDIHARKVFATTDLRHPGVKMVYGMKEYLLGGKVYVFQRKEKEHPVGYLSPAAVRKLLSDRGYATIAGFQTRNVPHRAHEYLQRCALEYVDALFVHPIIGWKKPGDFTEETIVSVYKEFIKDYYPKKRIVFGTLKTAMRYAGPREAIFHAIIRKNFGCTHFIVGRDHAGVGDYYGKYEAHDVFETTGDLGIRILKFKEPLYCSKCDLIVTEKTCGHGHKYHRRISGTLVRKIINNGSQPESRIFRPEVYRLLKMRLEKQCLFL